MNELLEVVLSKLELTSPWELVAVVFALAYLLLAVKRNLWCWLCAFVTSSIYVMLMFNARLYMQAGLNVFYVAMAIYGYWEWRRGRNSEGEVAIAQWRLKTHALAMGLIFVISVLNGWWLRNHSDASSPYLDSFTTWASVLTTWMVARRVIENWLYWIVVDAVSAFVFYQQHLYVTAALFVAYIGIVIHGYFVWLRESKRSGTLTAAT